MLAAGGPVTVTGLTGSCDVRASKGGDVTVEVTQLPLAQSSVRARAEGGCVSVVLSPPVDADLRLQAPRIRMSNAAAGAFDGTLANCEASGRLYVPLVAQSPVRGGSGKISRTAGTGAYDVSTAFFAQPGSTGQADALRPVVLASSVTGEVSVELLSWRENVMRKLNARLRNPSDE